MNRMQTKELWHISPDSSQLKNREMEKQNGDIHVKASYSLISLGTEKLVARGMVPESLHEVMKVPYMKGEFTFPLAYGYSLTGQIIDENAGYEGKAVHVLHPHANMARIQSHDVHFIPDGVPLKRATLASNMETIVNAVWDSRVTMGDRVLIVGLGMIGAMLALTLQSFPGIEICVVEKNEIRLQQGRDLNIPVISPRETIPSAFDLAFHCSASESGLQSCIDYTLPEASIVELSWYGNQSVHVKLGGTFHAGRKKILSSQVSKIPSNHAAGWDYKRRKNLVFTLLQDPIYDRLINREIEFEETPHFFTELRNGQVNDIGIVIKY